ncbi:MAG: HD domain-containing protein [Clostridia bacterium]|nr:HD domain-containing protein [Clostridia bacterium]
MHRKIERQLAYWVEKTRLMRQRLQQHGFEVHFVGGCVRDACLGVQAKDADMTTNALPDQMKEVLADFKLLETGLRHGTLSVFCEDCPVEITTYRVEKEYADHRHPDGVSFTSSLAEDLARRDFTVNAMAWSPETGLTDIFGGIRDLEAGIIRCVGNAQKRFFEDALRMLRALRFASVLDFTLDEEVCQALRESREELRFVSAERVLTELNGLLCGKAAARVMTEYTDVVGVWLPELLAMKGFEQHNPHHRFDVLTHCLKAVEQVPAQPVLRWAALLHDCGKPLTFSVDEAGVGHFYGHEKAGGAAAEAVFTRLKSSKTLRRSVCDLIQWHGRPCPEDPKGVGRMLNRLGEKSFFDLMCLKRADCLAQGTDVAARCACIKRAEETARELLAKQACFSLRQLAVDGRDLLALGVEEGPGMGALLEALLEQVEKGELPNEKEALLARARLSLKPDPPKEKNSSFLT